MRKAEQKNSQVGTEEAQRRRDSRSEPSRSEASSPKSAPDAQVLEKPRRRRFTAEYKLRILEEADGAASPGEIGLLLRREGLHSSHLTNWRNARRKGSLAQLSRKRGRKAKTTPEQKKIEQLEKKVRRLEDDLDKAQTILEVQGKVARLLGLPPSDGRSS
jgi:transposase-like protein